MNNVNFKTVLIFWIIFCAVLMLTTSFECRSLSTDQEKEGFYTYYGYYKKYCPSCGWRSRYSCSKCTNCGYCITPSGYGECVPGDSSGPYFREDCQSWIFGFYWPLSYLNLWQVLNY